MAYETCRLATFDLKHIGFAERVIVTNASEYVPVDVL
jgi:hypothetical protein